jgi:hypothetical protein
MCSAPSLKDSVAESLTTNPAQEQSRMLRQVDRHVSENEREGQVKKVLRLLEKPMTKSDLTKKTQSFGQRLRNEIIADLLDADQIATWFVDTGGSRRTQWLHKKED